MNYSEIVDSALAYADRQDAEVGDRMDTFLRITEARINRALQVQKMAIRTSLVTKIDQEYYALPPDFAGLRDIEIRATGSERSVRQTLHYMNPEQMNEFAATSGTSTKIYYTLIANQIQIMAPQDSMTLEIVYYRNVPPLGDTNLENWVSLYNPDLYLYGLMVEISSFVKDATAKQLWDERFVQALAEIERDDQQSRWSGTPLQIRLG